MELRYWIGLNAIDAVLTGLALALGGVEANPILNLFASHMGHPGMLFLKTLFAIALGGIIWQRGTLRTLAGLNYLMVGIVIYNMVVITYTL
ncbi:MAG: DUF5658 family protein [Dehalococcoidia bacterium]